MKFLLNTSFVFFFFISCSPEKNKTITRTTLKTVLSPSNSNKDFKKILCYKDLCISNKDLSKVSQEKILRLENLLYKEKINSAKEALLSNFIKKEAILQKTDKESFLKKLYKDIDVNKKEIQDFANTLSLKNTSPGLPVWVKLKDKLLKAKKRRSLIDFFNKKTKKGEIQIHLNKVDEPIFDNIATSNEEFIKGNSLSKNKIIFFTDPFCRHCLKSIKAIIPLVRTFSNEDFSLIFKIAISDKFNNPTKNKISKWLICSRNQIDKKSSFLDLYLEGLENKKNLREKNLIEISKKFLIQESSLKECLKSEKTQELIEKYALQSKDLNITATPTIFINNKKYSGALSTSFIQDQLK